MIRENDNVELSGAGINFNKLSYNTAKNYRGNVWGIHLSR
jgi:hypothetical protein